MNTIKASLCPNLSIENFPHCTGRGDSALILIATQDHPLSTCLRREIKQERHQVFEASTGEQCLDTYVRICPDLVLLDARISEIDGFSYCSKLSTLSECHPAPILMMLSLSDPAAIDRAFASGAADCLIKPFHRALWPHRIRHWLKQSQIAKQMQQLNSDLESQMRQRTAQFEQPAVQLEATVQLEAMLRRLSDKVIDSRDASQMLQTLIQEFASVWTHITELEILNRHKDEFLSTVSHELRNPIYNLRLVAELLDQSLRGGMAKGNQEVRLNPDFTNCASYLKILHDECEQLAALVDNLLELQRLESGEQATEAVPMPLKDWILSVVNPFQARAQACQLSLQIDIAPELPQSVSHPTQLKRILAELLNNACKYTPPGEFISLNVALAANQLQLSVRNSGVEIPGQELTRIFDKFYRIPNADIWEQGGTGLGLALVQQLVNALGGLYPS